MRFANIKKLDIINGSGIRVSLFVSGCNFHCKNCFNQEAQQFDYGKEYTHDTFNCICELINKPHIKGCSFLGGDVMWQTPEDIEELIKLCDYTHSINKNVWIWTGFTFEEIMQYNKSNEELSDEESARQKLLFHCDVLVDGRYVDEQRDLTLKWRGSSNQRVLNIPESLKQKQAVLLEGEN